MTFRQSKIILNRLLLLLLLINVGLRWIERGRGGEKNSRSCFAVQSWLGRFCFCRQQRLYDHILRMGVEMVLKVHAWQQVQHANWTLLLLHSDNLWLNASFYALSARARILITLELLILLRLLSHFATYGFFRLHFLFTFFISFHPFCFSETFSSYFFHGAVGGLPSLLKRMKTG